MAKTLKEADKKSERKVQEAEIQRKRILVKDVFYPWLLKNTKHVEEAKTFCQVVAMFIKQAYNAEMNAKMKTFSETETARLSKLKLSELDLSAMRKNKDLKDLLPILDIFKDETVANADTLVDTMAKAIDAFQKKEMLGRKLDTLKADFL